MIPLRTDITGCDHCGVCCRTPCLLGDFEDARRLAARAGLEPQKALHLFQFERTPAGDFQVRVRPRPDGGCPYHVKGRCEVHDIKPRGGREFKCWQIGTFALRYFWPLSEIDKFENETLSRVCRREEADGPA